MSTNHKSRLRIPTVQLAGVDVAFLTLGVMSQARICIRGFKLKALLYPFHQSNLENRVLSSQGRACTALPRRACSPTAPGVGGASSENKVQKLKALSVTPFLSQIKKKKWKKKTPVVGLVAFNPGGRLAPAHPSSWPRGGTAS